MTVYEKRNATDEEIRNCRGDYIGCEICPNMHRCFELMLERLDKVMHNKEECK